MDILWNGTLEHCYVVGLVLVDVVIQTSLKKCDTGTLLYRVELSVSCYAILEILIEKVHWNTTM